MSCVLCLLSNSNRETLSPSRHGSSVYGLLLWQQSQVKEEPNQSCVECRSWNNNHVHLSCAHQRPECSHIHVNLNMKLYTHIEHSPTETTHTKHCTERPTTKWRPCLWLYFQQFAWFQQFVMVRLQGSVCISVCFFTPSRKSMILSLLGGGGTFLTA